MNLCPLKIYKNILGIPRKGTHSYRIMDVALVDYILTILLSFITTYISKIPIVITTILWFSISIFIHMLFGVETNTIKYLGLSC